MSHPHYVAWIWHATFRQYQRCCFKEGFCARTATIRAASRPGPRSGKYFVQPGWLAALSAIVARQGTTPSGQGKGTLEARPDKAVAPENRDTCLILIWIKVSFPDTPYNGGAGEQGQRLSLRGHARDRSHLSIPSIGGERYAQEPARYRLGSRPG